MYKRKINLLLVLLSILGGVIGFGIGELILAQWEGRLPNILLIGIYFGQLALFIGLTCMIAELVSPELNGKGWRLRYAKEGWKLLVPATLVLLFIGGALLQFIYGLYFGKHQPPQDILVAIDVSESMTKTDPSRESFQAAKQLVQNMEPDKRVAVLTFNNRSQLLQGLTPMSDVAGKQGLIVKLDNYGAPTGGTDIGGALETVMDQIRAAKADARKSMVILISDGYSDVDLDRALAPYRDEEIAVNTVGVNVGDIQGNQLLRMIASKTDGSFHSVSDISKLSSVFNKIYKSNQGWHLVGERTGSAVDSVYYTLLRIMFLTVIGSLLGLSLGIVFDNRFLARSFAFGGAVAGLLAGLILEFGLKNAVIPAGTCRAAADIVLAVVLSLSTIIVAYKENQSADGNNLYQRNRRDGGYGFGQQPSDQNQNKFQ